MIRIVFLSFLCTYLPTVLTSTDCAAVIAPIDGFAYAQQYMRGNYSDGNGTDHVLATGSPGEAWSLEYSIGFGAFLSDIGKCAAGCLYKLTAYTKPYNGTDTRTLMKLDTIPSARPGSTAFGADYTTAFSPTSTMYCAQQSGFCGAVTPIYLYYNNITDDYTTRGSTQPNGTEEDPDSWIANGGKPWCYLFQPPTTTTTTVSTSSGPTTSTTTVKSSSTSSASTTTTSTLSTTSGSSTSSPTSTTTSSGSSTTTSSGSSTTTSPTTTRTTTTEMTTTRTPATTTTVPTTTSLYVYPATTDASGTFAPDDTKYPNGTIVRANGDVIYPNGTVVTADGTTIVDGTKIAPNGTVYNPNGSTTYPNGTTLNSDGSTTYPNGTTVTAGGTAYNPGGVVSYPNGTVAYPNGTTTNTDGSYQAPNGVTYYPNGTQKYEDGTVVSTDGTVTSPDGTVTYPNGTVVAGPVKTTTKSGGGISLGWPLIIVGVIVGAAVAIGVIYGLTIAFIKSGSRAVSPEQYNQYEHYRRDSAMVPPRVAQPAYAAPPPFS